LTINSFHWDSHAQQAISMAMMLMQNSFIMVVTMILVLAIR